MSRPSLVGADEAVARVHDGDTLLGGGFGGHEPPDQWASGAIADGGDAD